MCNTRNYYAVYEIKTAKIVDFVSLQNPVIDPAWPLTIQKTNLERFLP